MLVPIFECGKVCWDRYLSEERCVGNDRWVRSGVLGRIDECGTVCLDLYLSV